MPIAILLPKRVSMRCGDEAIALKRDRVCFLKSKIKGIPWPSFHTYNFLSVYVLPGKDREKDRRCSVAPSQVLNKRLPPEIF
jgi:hypothetical protein